MLNPHDKTREDDSDAAPRSSGPSGPPPSGEPSRDSHPAGSFPAAGEAATAATSAAESGKSTERDRRDGGDRLIGRRIGAYRVLRAIARGGMGAVYEAEQESPSRRVALKLMRDALSPVARRRFDYEAEILAHLSHPGIAQVYEVGTARIDGEDLPFFALELVPGAATILEHANRRGLSTTQRLELLAQVAEIVHHGHQRGIIHRDLKPGNILIDSDGHPKLIDFGIARAVDGELETGGSLTLTGQIVGTPQYMSPEQCSGNPHDIDLRTDVYSLGVVLYELLSGALPYDVSACSVPELVHRIRESPPRRPSTVMSALRGDVETIVLKALAKEPSARYPSAAELAADIGRFLAREPILARPPSVAYQLRLFARRHRSLVAGVIVAMIALLAATTVSAVFAVQAREAARRETERATAEQEERERAARLFSRGHEFARWTLGDFEHRLAESFGATELRVELLERIRGYLEELEKDATDDSGLLADMARAWLDIGDALGGFSGSSLGRPREAVVAYREAIRVDLRRAALLPDDHAIARDLVAHRLRLIDALLELGETASAESETALASALVAQLEREAPDAPEPRRLEIELRLRRADALARNGDSPGAERLLRETIAFGEECAARFENSRPFVFDTAYAYAALGDFLQSRGENQEAAAAFRSFEERVSQFASEAPEGLDASVARTLASMHIRSGDARWHTESAESALAAYQASLEIDRGLLRRDPADQLARAHLAISFERVGNAYEELDRIEEALEAYRQTVSIREAMNRDLPESPPRLWAHAIGLRTLSSALSKSGALLEAHESLSKAAAIRERLATESPDNTAYVREWAVTRFDLGTLASQIGASTDDTARFREALGHFETSATLLEGLAARGELAESDARIPAVAREAAAACAAGLAQLEELDRAESESEAAP